MQWDRRPRLAFLLIVGLLAAMMMLSACGSGRAAEPAGEAIGVEMLPAGLGRGFPEVVVLAEDNRGPKVGETTPGFRMVLADGSHINIEDLQGRPVMINFWATWCPPCRREMPDIIAASEAHEDLVVLAVNVQEDLKIVEPFVNDFGISMPVLMDGEGKLRNAYGVSGMPTSVFVDQEGNVSAIWSGLLNAEKLNELLNEIL